MKEGSIKSLSIAMISDHLTHNTAAVNEFQHVLIGHLKQKISVPIEKVLYFSDGCKAQYKNRKNFSYIASHESDFGMPAEWHFFANSHGEGSLQ